MSNLWSGRFAGEPEHEDGGRLADVPRRGVVGGGVRTGQAVEAADAVHADDRIEAVEQLDERQAHAVDADGRPGLEGQLQRRRRLRRRAPLPRDAVETAGHLGVWCQALLAADDRDAGRGIARLGLGRRVRIHERRRPHEAAGAGACRLRQLLELGVEAGVVMATAVGQERGVLHRRDLDQRLHDRRQPQLARQRHTALLRAARPERGQQELQRQRVAHVHHVRPHGTGLEGRLAHGVQILALAQIERQRDDLVAFDLDQVPHRRRFHRPARERESDACLVSH